MTDTEQNTNTLTDPSTRLQLRLPKDAYKFRIKAEPEFQLSKKEKEMLVFNTEIIEPDVVSVRDTQGQRHELTCKGLEIILRAVFVEYRGKIENFTLAALHKQVGLPLDFSRDPETGLPTDSSGTPISYVGLEFWASAEAKENVQLKEDGKPMINPLTGKPVVTYPRNILDIFVN